MTYYFHGKPTCECGAESLPLVEQVMLAKGLIRYNLDIYQLIGSAPASAGTHAAGLVVDSGQYSDAQLRVWRDMGYDASWHRRTSQGFSIDHHHGVARGCPHNNQADYQITAVDNGRNGLANNGYDDGPKPLSHRTWQEGVAWAKAFLAGAPADPGPFQFTAMNWNVASPKWFTPWDGRKAGIGKVISDINPDVLFCQETHYSYMTADILAALGPDFNHVSSPVGNDMFYRDSMFDSSLPVFKEYPMNVQGRAVAVKHVKTKTGREVALINTHAPAMYPTYRTTFGNRAAPLIADVDGARVVSGDWNTRYNDNSPRKQLRAIGFRSERDQMDFYGENDQEFPGKGWLCGTYTKPSEAKIVGGRLHVTSASLSDHRPFTTRIVVL